METVENKIVKAQVSFSDWVRQYLTLWNGIMNLSPAELDMLVEMVTIYEELKPSVLTKEERFKVLFSTPKRKEIRKKLSMSEQLMNNRINALKKKKVLFRTPEGEYSLTDKVLPLKEITFKYDIV